MARRIGRLALLAAVLAGAAAIVIWRLSWLAPTWWVPPDASDERVIALADRVEYGLVEQAHKIRPGSESWHIEIPEPRINAWLSARLPAWLTHAHDLHWPRQLGPPQVHLEDGAVNIAMTLGTDARRRFVVAHLVPSIIDGDLTLTVDRVSLGRVTVPSEPVQMLVGRLQAAAPAGFVDDPAVQAAIQLLSGQQRIDPSLTLADGRTVRLLEIRVTRDAVILLCETVAAVASEAPSGRGRDQ